MRHTQHTDWGYWSVPQRSIAQCVKVKGYEMEMHPISLKVTCLIRTVRCLWWVCWRSSTTWLWTLWRIWFSHWGPFPRPLVPDPGQANGIKVLANVRPCSTGIHKVRNQLSRWLECAKFSRVAILWRWLRVFLVQWVLVIYVLSTLRPLPLSKVEMFWNMHGLCMKWVLLLI